jgi:hypothetical protein
LTTSALREQDDTISFGIEVLTIRRANATSRTTMNVDYGVSILMLLKLVSRQLCMSQKRNDMAYRIASLLVMQGVNICDIQESSIKRFNKIIKLFSDGHDEKYSKCSCKATGKKG